MKRPLSLIILFLCIQLHAQQHDRASLLGQLLDSLSQEMPALQEAVHLNLQDVPLHGYVRALGRAHQVNVFIENTPKLRMTQQLHGEPLKSVFIFICLQYQYDIQLSGGIFRFLPYQPPSPQKIRKIQVSYEQGLLSMDLKQDSLLAVVKAISRLTNEKIIAPVGSQLLVSGYIPPSAVELGLELMAKANGLRVHRNRKGYIVLSPGKPHAQPQAPPTQTAVYSHFQVEAFSDADQLLLSIEARQAALPTLLQEIFEQAQTDHIMLGEPTGMISLQLEAASLDDILGHILKATPFSYKKSGRLYLIGPEDLPDMQGLEIVELKYRPTYQALDLIPGLAQSDPSEATYRPNLANQAQGIASELQDRKRVVDGVELIEYPELNRIILRGPQDHVDEIAEFLQEIDQPIPMVKVELVVVEVNKNAALQTGIRAGLGSSPDSSAKQILPGVDYNLDGQTINRILRSSPSPFLQQLGVLSPNFYVQLQAQEAMGNLEVVMTPMLSMLNGKEAKLTIGQKQYYLLETTTASNGAVNNFQQFSQQFTEIEANITLTIRPFVSDGDMVTLDIIPDFSTPIGGFVAGVPPTIATRKFDSSIRVRNGESFILGGLTQEEKSENGSGVPVLSRIPVLKWLFSNKNKSKSESTLVIYVTPHIYYQ